MLKHCAVENPHPFNVDLANDDKSSIISEIDKTVNSLNHETSCLLHLTTSLYNIRKFGDRINRYRDFLNNTKLTMEDCTHIAQYCKEIVLSFLQTPLTDFKNVYQYDPTTDRWIIVSPTGYLWLIYGDRARKIRITGKYLHSLIVDDNILLTDLKNALAFTNRCVSALFINQNSAPFLTDLLMDTFFIEQYQKLITIIKAESARNSILSTNI